MIIIIIITTIIAENDGGDDFATILDLSAEMLALAPASTERVRADVRQRLPLRPGVVDAVLSVSALHFLLPEEAAPEEDARGEPADVAAAAAEWRELVEASSGVVRLPKCKVWSPSAAALADPAIQAVCGRLGGTTVRKTY